jgi:transposase-like protein
MDATIDFVLSALRDAAAAKRLFRKALCEPSHPQPRVINTIRKGQARWVSWADVRQ